MSKHLLGSPFEGGGDNEKRRSGDEDVRCGDNDPHIGPPSVRQQIGGEVVHVEVNGEQENVGC